MRPEIKSFPGHKVHEMEKSNPSVQANRGSTPPTQPQNFVPLATVSVLRTRYFDLKAATVSQRSYDGDARQRARSEVLTGLTMKTVLWDVTPCSPVVTKHFGEACYLHHQGSYTLCHIPGDQIFTERKVNTAEGECTHACAVMKHLYAETGRVMRNGAPWGMHTVTEAGKVSISGSDGTCNDALRALRPQQYHI